jgi:rare lipoprotein A
MLVDRSEFLDICDDVRGGDGRERQRSGRRTIAAAADAFFPKRTNRFPTARIGAAVVMLGFAFAICVNLSNRIDSEYDVTSGVRVVGAGRPVPKGGGAYRVGNPYVIAGRTYTPREDPNYYAEGIASWYGEDFHGRLTANGEIFDMYALSAAHPTLPLPSYVRVTNLENSHSLVVRLNDRGPYHSNRLIDVSVRTAKLLGFYEQGIVRIRVEYVSRAELEGSDDDKLAATLRYDDLPAVQVAANESEISNLVSIDRGSTPVSSQRTFAFDEAEISTVSAPDIGGSAATTDSVGKTDMEVREPIDDQFSKLIDD